MAGSLARLGWDVLLLERDRLPRHKVCGEFLSPEARLSLHNLGLYPVVNGLGPAPLTGAVLTTRRGTTVELPLPGQAWGLSRFVLDASLAQAAVRQGAQLCMGATVTACTRPNGHYRLRLRGKNTPDQVQARAVIMACGRHSWPGLSPGIAPDKNPKRGWRRCVGLKTHYNHIEMPPRVELYLFSGGYAGINPIEQGRANVCLLMTYDAFERAGKSVAGAIAAVAARHNLLARRLNSGRALPETACAVAPVDTHRPARPWAGVACLGDTAAMIPPLTGDGMAMALRSTELCLPLADAFLRGRLSLTGWANAYNRAWQAEFNRRLVVGRLLQNLLAAPWSGEALVSLGRWWPGLADYFVRATRGTVLAWPPLNSGAG